MQYFLIILILAVFTITLGFGGVSDTYSQEKTPLTLLQFNKSTGFILPIDCKMGEDCHVMNYVDFIPNDGKQSDPACLSRTYDNHKGTDFAILDEQAMEKGVNVLAALDGTITKIRNGETDEWRTQEQLDDIKAQRKECGNAVMIDHGNAVQTIYCHMKKDSITVKPNQTIKAGDKIGEVGLSGFTQFPHLHFGILKNKKIIDPFTGQNNMQPCGKNKKPLWKKEIGLHYQPFTIQSGGFLNDIPELKKIERDNNNKKIILPNSKIFTFWGILLGMQKGDIITLEIKDPNGKILARNEIIQDKVRARQFYYIGKNLKNKRLIEGAYTGLIKISRKNKNGEKITKDKLLTVLVSQ